MQVGNCIEKQTSRRAAVLAVLRDFIIGVANRYGCTACKPAPLPKKQGCKLRKGCEGASRRVFIQSCLGNFAKNQQKPEKYHIVIKNLHVAY